MCLGNHTPHTHHHQGFKRSLHAGAPGNAEHAIWKPCFFACVRVVSCSGGLWDSLSSPRFCSWMCEFRVYCWVVQWSPFCGASPIFLHTVVGLQASPRFSAVGALSQCRQIRGARSTADRQATCQVASTHSSRSYESVCSVGPSGGKDAQTAVRKLLPDLWGVKRTPHKTIFAV